MDNFSVTILNNEKTKLKSEFYMALLPLYEGETGIMAGHVNYNALIAPGLLKLLHKDGRVLNTMFISGGIAEVLDGKLTILADNIIDIQDITHEEALAKVNNLKESLQDISLEIEQIEYLSQELQAYNKIINQKFN